VGAWWLGGAHPPAAYGAVRGGVGAYGASLERRPELVALNKVDLIPEAERDASLAPLEAELRGRGRAVLRISGATGLGSDALVAALGLALDAEDAAAAREAGGPAAPWGRSRRGRSAPAGRWGPWASTPTGQC